jgi:ligand-binding sensor domain-containing protein
MKQASALSFLLVLITCCNGQGPAVLQKNSIAESDSTTAGEPRKYVVAPENFPVEVESKTTLYSPSGNIRSSLRDRAGNLWFGTWQGLFRYNGISFTVFTEKPKEGLVYNSLNALSRVYAITEDKSGNLWFGTEYGVLCYDGKVFSSISMPADDSTGLYPSNASSTVYPSSKHVLSIVQDRLGNFWFGTCGGGAYRYDGQSFTRYLYNGGAVYGNGLHNNVIESVLEDKAGNIWFTSMSHGSVYRYDGNRVEATERGENLPVSEQQDLKRKNGKLVKSITNFTPEDGLSDDMVFCVFQDSKGNLWFGTRDNGVCRYNGRSFTCFSEKDGLCNNNVSCIVEDRAGNLWFASNRGGLCRYDGRYFTDFTTKDGLCNNAVWTMVEDNAGNIWIGTRDGLCRYNGYNGQSFTGFTEKESKQ